MLINKDEIAKMVMSGEITDSDSLNAVLRGIIKNVVESDMRKTNLLKLTTATGAMVLPKRKSPPNLDRLSLMSRVIAMPNFCRK